MIRIVLIESDALHSYAIQKSIQVAWHWLDFGITTLSCETDFRADFEHIAADPPNLVITGQMIRYGGALGGEALARSFFEGGTRCHYLLQSDERTRSIPVIFFTVLEKESVPEGAVYVQKKPSPGGGLVELIQKIKELLHLSG